MKCIPALPLIAVWSPPFTIRDAAINCWLSGFRVDFNANTVSSIHEHAHIWTWSPMVWTENSSDAFACDKIISMLLEGRMGDSIRLRCAWPNACSSIRSPIHTHIHPWAICQASITGSLHMHNHLLFKWSLEEIIYLPNKRQYISYFCIASRMRCAPLTIFHNLLSLASIGCILVLQRHV